VPDNPIESAIDRKAEAAHKRIDDVDRRLTRLETTFTAHDRRLEEVARDVKELMKVVYRGSMTGGAMGGGGALIAYLLWQSMNGGGP
jgi:hypothetical protein